MPLTNFTEGLRGIVQLSASCAACVRCGCSDYPCDYEIDEERDG